MKKPFSPLQWSLLLIIFTFIWFAPLDLRYLIPTDEGRYAEIAREMWATGDWITPRYNGYLYFEKPPLQTWFNTLTFYIFGIGEWQARFYTALTGFACVFLIAQTGRLIFKSTAIGFYAGLILASIPYWNILGHFNSLDMGLSFWMTFSLCSLLLAQRSDIEVKVQRYWMWGCWAGMALAFLSKGLIGLILPGTVLILYSIALRDWTIWRRLHLVSGSIVFLILAAPWFILVEQRNPGFADFFFITQQFRRYLTPEQQRPGPWYYFIPVLIVGFLPWLSLMLHSSWQFGKQVIGRQYARDRRPFFPQQSNGFSPIALLLIWSVFIFIFFSASYSKLTSYILPIAPAITLLLGAAAARLLTPTQWRRHLTGAAAITSLVLTGLLVFQMADYFLVFPIGNARTPHVFYSHYFIWVDIALLFVLLGSLLARFSLPIRIAISSRQRPVEEPPYDTQSEGLSTSLLIYASTWGIALTIAISAHNLFGSASSGVKLVPAIQAEMKASPATTPFYSVKMLDHTLPFYLRHTMIMVEHPDELRYGVTQEPEKWVPTLNDWKTRWQKDSYAFALLSPTLYNELAAKGFPMRVIARDGRRVVIGKP